jgi:outer membrane protein assembly factor BamB
MRTLLFLALASSALAADWPMYRGDAARSGYSTETIPNQLRLRWTFRPGLPPRPAWPTSERMEFDRVFQPILVGDLVLFGSSADDQVYALDARTGDVRWRFFSEGPIRFAPAAWQDRVFVASDDGFLYTLALKDGSMLWKHRAGPDARRVIGNERLICHWPARGGPVVWQDTVYYCGGIWPSDGVYVHALDAATGQPRWSNGETGGLQMAQPHGGANAKSGVAPQGYLLANDTALIVPTGRAVPAVFERGNGKLRYYHLQKNQQQGGTRVAVAENTFLNSGCVFDLATGELTGKLGLGPTVVVPGGVVRAENRSLALYRWQMIDKMDRRGKVSKVRVLEQSKVAPLERDALEFIITGSEAVVGSDGQISAIDYNGQRTQWWKHAVEGRVLGLAAGNGRVVATTDRGVVYLFDGQPGPSPASSPEVATDIAPTAAAQAEARHILDVAGMTAGHAVLLGAGRGDLAVALARTSDLQIMVVEPDRRLADELRRRSASAGLYGSRIAVLSAALEQTFLPKQFANLVIAPPGAKASLSANLRKEMERLRRPYGGMICLREGDMVRVEKSGVPIGAGSWTHQNSNAANTLCSDDEVIRGKLSMFWFRDMEFEVANRHGQGPAPLVGQGYMVVSGVHGVCCLDAFNGRKLWEFALPDLLADYDGIHHDVGVGDTGGPLCMGGDSVYVKSGARCFRIELATGRVLREFKTPAKADATDRNWGYLAYEEGVLFGSIENQNHNVSPRYGMTGLRTESTLFFAMDPATGKEKWRYQPAGSIRHNAIAIAEGRVYLIDRPLIAADRVANPVRNGRSGKRLLAPEVPDGTLLALDARSGRILWRNTEDIYGTQLAVSAKHKVLLMNYKAVRHNFFEIPSEVGGRLSGIDTATGKRIWDQEGKYQTRPLINDQTIYAQGGAWDLKTGSLLPWELQRSYGCGQISASRNLMLFRSATLGYVDLSRSAATENYGGIRPSCWINAIPASGLVLVPDGSSKCHCSYQMRTWFALQGE